MSSSGKSSGHILIIRFSAMGDVVMSLFAVRALRLSYPDLRITVATKDRFAKFYRDLPGVELLTLPKNDRFRDLFSLASQARRSGVDCVADIHNTLRGKVIRFLLRCTGARVAVFDKRRKERKALKHRRGGEIRPIRHNVLRFCDVFARLGYPVPDPVQERVVRPVPSAFGTKEGTWVGYAPFASKASKIYPETLARELVGMMSASYGRVFIFCGPGKEKEFADEMERLHPNVTAVFGRTDIWGEMDLMSNLDAIVTMDSSAMHMASMVGTPLVSVWGATHPAAGFYGYGYDMERSAVQLDLECRPCSIFGEGECKRGDLWCLNGIRPETVMEKLKEVAD